MSDLALPRHLLPMDQQLVTVELPLQFTLGRVMVCEPSGVISLTLPASQPDLDILLERRGPLKLEYVKDSLCRASFVPDTFDLSPHLFAPVMLPRGRLIAIESIQRRQGFRVRLAIAIELFHIAEQEDVPARERIWSKGRTLDISHDGLCIEIDRPLGAGNLVTLRLYAGAHTIEADARVVGPRLPPGPSTSKFYGLEIIQMSRADQRLLTTLVRAEERRVLALRLEREPSR